MKFFRKSLQQCLNPTLITLLAVAGPAPDPLARLCCQYQKPALSLQSPCYSNPLTRLKGHPHPSNIHFVQNRVIKRDLQESNAMYICTGKQNYCRNMLKFSARTKMYNKMANLITSLKQMNVKLHIQSAMNISKAKHYYKQ